MQKRVEDTIERLKGRHVCGYTIDNVTADNDDNGCVVFCFTLQSPAPHKRRFNVSSSVRMLAIENDKFDLYRFLLERLIQCTKKINKSIY